MITKKTTRGLGVAHSDFKTYLFYKVLYSVKPEKVDDKSLFQAGLSRNGSSFGLLDDSANIKIANDKKENIERTSAFRISDFGDFYLLTYILDQDDNRTLCIARSTDLINWTKQGEIEGVTSAGMIVPDYKFEGQFVLYFGGNNLGIAFSKNLKTWKVRTDPVFNPDISDGPEVLVGNTSVNGKGILLLFYQIKEGDVVDKHSVKAVLFEKENAEKLIWSGAKQVWDQIDDWTGQNVDPIGLIRRDNGLISYWQNGEKNIFAISSDFYKPTKEGLVHPKIRKFVKNPVLMPIVDNFWESKAVFNPAAVYDEDMVHIVYRAVGDDDVSSFGYAKSRDGLDINQRSKGPIPVHDNIFAIYLF